MKLIKAYQTRLQSILNDPSRTWSEKAAALFQIAKGNAILERQAEVTEKVDLYEGNQDPYLQADLTARFKDNKEILAQRDWYNITKLIIDRISIIYQNQATRELVNVDGKSKVSDREIALFDAIMKHSNWSEFMQTVNTYTNICNEVVVRPFFFSPEGSIRLQMITTDKVYPIANDEDQTELEALIYQTFHYDSMEPSDTEQAITYNLWTDENFAILVEQTGGAWVIKNNPTNLDNVNPYGMLPAVLSRAKVAKDRIFSDEGKDIINLQKSVNRLVCQINELSHTQSFAVPVLTGWTQDLTGKTGEIVISPGKPLLIPPGDKNMDTPPGFSYETPNSKISDLVDTLNTKISQIGQIYGISPSDFKQEGSPSSGYALSIQNRHLIDRWSKEHVFYQNTEQRMFEIVKAIWNYHQTAVYNDKDNKPTMMTGVSDGLLSEFKGVKFSDSTRLNCIIHQLEYPPSPVEVTEKWDWYLEKKLETPVDYYIRVEGMSETEAQEKWEKTAKWYEENKSEPETPFEVEKPGEDIVVGTDKNDGREKIIGKVAPEVMEEEEDEKV